MVRVDTIFGLCDARGSILSTCTLFYALEIISSIVPFYTHVWWWFLAIVKKVFQHGFEP